MLNAFRHHRLFHRDTLVMLGALFECSTPFGITDYSTYNAGRSPARCNVLNAFRHHRLFHPSTRGTPFWFLSGAQRLSASQTIPHSNKVAITGLTVLCSTPFGITDYSTMYCAFNATRPILVLNAFRHHRLFHLPMVPRHRRIRLVLNAFRHHRLFHENPQVTLNSWKCAQRLSASQTIPQRRGEHGNTDLRCSTPFGITDYSTRRKSKRRGNGL